MKSLHHHIQSQWGMRKQKAVYVYMYPETDVTSKKEMHVGRACNQPESIPFESPCCTSHSTVLAECGCLSSLMRLMIGNLRLYLVANVLLLMVRKSAVIWDDATSEGKH